MSKMSHYSAGYRAGPDHTNKNGSRDTFRSRQQERADRIPGFKGVKQGLSCREPMGQDGKYLEIDLAGMYP